MFSDPERGTTTRPVDPAKEKELIEELFVRGTFDDDTTVIPETGKMVPDVIFALSRTTQSILIYTEGKLTYVEGSNGPDADAHSAIFRDATIDNSKHM